MATKIIISVFHPFYRVLVKQSDFFSHVKKLGEQVALERTLAVYNLSS